MVNILYYNTIYAANKNSSQILYLLLITQWQWRIYGGFKGLDPHQKYGGEGDPKFMYYKMYCFYNEV